MDRDVALHEDRAAIRIQARSDQQPDLELRHRRLYWAAARAGEHSAHGTLDYHTARDALIRAGETVGATDTTRTVDDGLRKGAAA